MSIFGQHESVKKRRFSPRERRLNLARRFNAGSRKSNPPRRVATAEFRLVIQASLRDAGLWGSPLPSPEGLG